MSTLMVVYETKYGQTRKIAERIAEIARGRGHRTEVAAVTDIEPRKLGNADAYVVLAPVYVGKHPTATKSFLDRYGDALNLRPSTFVSVSGSAGSPREASRRAAQERAAAFVMDTPWRPKVIRTIGGAIDYPAYGFFTRFVMKRISRKEGRSTDTSRVDELTDWSEVERLTRELLAYVERTSIRQQARPPA
jgi:menaquinone-dependent protoporphyrinogen oxidase